MLVAPGIMSVFMGNPKISTNCESPIIGGIVPVPRTALVLRDGVVFPSLELSLQRGCHSGGGVGITCRNPRSVEKNIVGISNRA